MTDMTFENLWSSSFLANQFCFAVQFCAVVCKHLSQQVPWLPSESFLIFLSLIVFKNCLSISCNPVLSVSLCNACLWLFSSGLSSTYFFKFVSRCGRRRSAFGNWCNSLRTLLANKKRLVSAGKPHRGFVPLRNQTRRYFRRTPAAPDYTKTPHVGIRRISCGETPISARWRDSNCQWAAVSSTKFRMALVTKTTSMVHKWFVNGSWVVRNPVWPVL